MINVDLYIRFTHNLKNKTKHLGTFLATQWLRLHAPKAGNVGLVAGWGTKILMLHDTAKKQTKLLKRRSEAT